MDRTEGYDEIFDPPLENKYECPICLLGLREPVQTECGHRFCRACILRSLREVGFKCPVDNVPLTESGLYPDNFAKREMSSFTVRCRLYKERGCPWKGPLKDLEGHMKDCPFSDAQCPNACGIRVQLQELEKHMKKDCPNRTMECPICHQGIFAALVEWHIEEQHFKEQEERTVTSASVPSAGPSTSHDEPTPPPPEPVLSNGTREDWEEDMDWE